LKFTNCWCLTQELRRSMGRRRSVYFFIVEELRAEDNTSWLSFPQGICKSTPALQAFSDAWGKGNGTKIIIDIIYGFASKTLLLLQIPCGNDKHEGSNKPAGVTTLLCLPIRVVIPAGNLRNRARLFRF